ncbi:MAG: class I SAM-dependent methyltransferase [Acidimicrobiia bacterium]
MAIDLEAAREFALKVWKYREGEAVSLLIHLGDRLGLYAALEDGVPRTAVELADETGLDERWVREWLAGQAAADLVERDAEGNYRMGPEARAVLVDEESLLFAAGGFSGGRPPELVDRIAGAFQTGIGLPYGEMDEAIAIQIDRMNGAWLRDFLVNAVIPLLDGVTTKLENGAKVADVGCGGGVAIEALARRYPESSFEGIDSSGHAIRRAESRLADLPNATAVLSDGDGLAATGDYDLVMTLDMLHDAPRPGSIAAAVRQALAPDGAWLIKDIRCGPTFESNLKNPVHAMMYGFSIETCLISATSTPDGAGLGTLGLHPDRLESLVRDAGFTSFRTHDPRDPVNLYYEVRI